MQLARSTIALETYRRRARIIAARAVRRDPRRFGCGPAWQLAKVEVPARWTADLKLFATTFIAGLLFVSILFA